MPASTLVGVTPKGLCQGEEGAPCHPCFSLLPMNKIIVDSKEGSGVIPHLPLNELTKGARGAAGGTQ